MVVTPGKRQEAWSTGQGSTVGTAGSGGQKEAGCRAAAWAFGSIPVQLGPLSGPYSLSHSLPMIRKFHSDLSSIAFLTFFPQFIKYLHTA